MPPFAFFWLFLFSRATSFLSKLFRFFLQFFLSLVPRVHPPPTTNRMGNLCSRIEVVADDLYSRVRSLEREAGGETTTERQGNWACGQTATKRNSLSLSMPPLPFPFSRSFSLSLLLSFSLSVQFIAQPWKPDVGDAAKNGRRSDGGYEVKKWRIERRRRRGERGPIRGGGQRRSSPPLPCDVVFFSFALFFSFEYLPFFSSFIKRPWRASPAPRARPSQH